MIDMLHAADCARNQLGFFAVMLHALLQSRRWHTGTSCYQVVFQDVSLQDRMTEL